MRTPSFYLLLLTFALAVCTKAQYGFYYLPVDKKKTLLIAEGFNYRALDIFDTTASEESIFPGLWALLDADDKKVLGIEAARKEEDLVVLMRAGVADDYHSNYQWGTLDNDLNATPSGRQEVIDEYIAKKYTVYLVPPPDGKPKDPLPKGKYPYLQPGVLSGKIKPSSGITPVTTTSRATLVPYLTKEYEYIYVDSATMKPVITDRYDEASPFRDGLARIKKEGYYGYIDITGKQVIPPMFGKAYHFANGVAIVGKKATLSIEETYGLINKKGMYIYPLEYYHISVAGINQLKMAKDYPYSGRPEYYYIKPNGEKLFDISFREAGMYSNGFAPVKKQTASYYTYIDEQGKESINTGTSYTDANTFSGGRAAVKLDGKWGFIDKKGKMVIQNSYDEVQNFRENVAAVKKGDKWIYIDQDGKQVIDQQFDYAYYFQQGVAFVRLNGRYVVINKNGKEVFPNEFLTVSPYIDGLAKVYDRKTSEHQVINGTGKVVYSSPKNFSLTTFFYTGLFEISPAGYTFYIDRAGRQYRER